VTQSRGIDLAKVARVIAIPKAREIAADPSLPLSNWTLSVFEIISLTSFILAVKGILSVGTEGVI
jgi:hypothetical protein